MCVAGEGLARGSEANIKSLRFAPYLSLPRGRGGGVAGFCEGGRAMPFYHAMLAVGDSELPPEYAAFLEKWSEVLGVPVEALLARIVIATIDGFLYTEKIPDYYPESRGVID